MKNKGLAFKLILFILTSTALIFIAAFLYNYYSSERIILETVEASARNQTLATVNKIETVLRAVEKIPRTFVSFVEEHRYCRDDYLRLVRNAVEENREIYAFSVAFEPYRFSTDSQYFKPTAFRDKSGEVKTLPPEYVPSPYFYLDWYQIPRELGQACWSEPYYNAYYGDIIMSTFSVPFLRMVAGKKVVAGVAAADISLQALKSIVASVKIYQSGYAFLISQNGVFVTHPNIALPMRSTIFSVAEETGDPALRAIGKKMISGGTGFVTLKDFFTGKPSRMFYAPLRSSGWSVGVIFPEEELFAGIHTLSREILIIGVLGFLLLVVTISIIASTITRPLKRLDETTREIAQGNLDAELPVTGSNDEIGRLAHSFGEMKTALKEYIANLAATTAAKERIESELKIARTIQMSFLPKRFPHLPEKDCFEIYALLEPAKEVGGDLYDFFLLDDTHLFFTVGDVSDKGVPAALFMAVTKTLLKGMAEAGARPSEIFEKVNVELCQDNDSMMFVTVFCGILDLRTGDLSYSNAGHDPPILVRAGKSPVTVPIPPGLVLGAYPEAQYKTMKTRLEVGDMIVAYTDGVTEAMNPEKELYSPERLMEAVAEKHAEKAEEQVTRVFDSVREFVSGAIQSDDITVLSVKLTKLKT